MFGYILVTYFLTRLVVVPVINLSLRAVFESFGKKFKGRSGESAVNRCLRKFKGNEFAHAKDVMLPLRGRTSQIDNLLISRYGIFVIETKNYSGTVKGKERSPMWLHILPGSNKKPREFYNPIFQNESHIKALRELLERKFPTIQYHNIVVFSDECRFPQFPGVVKMSKLRDVLKERMDRRPLLSESQVAEIKNIIDSVNIKDKGKRSQHVGYAESVADAFKIRRSEKEQLLQKETNKETAMFVQSVYSRSFDNLDDVISVAEKKASESFNDTLSKNNDLQR